MKQINKLLVIPFITPLIAILFIATLNFNKTTKIRILTWKSSEISLGLLMVLGSSAGAISAIASTIITPDNQIQLKRKGKQHKKNIKA